MCSCEVKVWHESTAWGNGLVLTGKTQRWQRFMMQYGITRPQWVNILRPEQNKHCLTFPNWHTTFSNAFSFIFFLLIFCNNFSEKGLNDIKEINICSSCGLEASGNSNLTKIQGALLTYLPQDKMAATSQTTVSNALSWMKSFSFRFEFHWSLFLRVQLTIKQHWFR